VLISGKIGLHLRSPEAFTFDTLPSQILLIHAWSGHVSWNVPSWSISAEWFAYLCFRLVAFSLARVRYPRWAVVIAILSLGTSASIFTLSGWGLSGAWTAPSALVRIMGSFVCGVALCRYAVLSGLMESNSRRNDAVAMAALILFLSGIAIGLPDFISVALLAVFVGALAMSRGITAQLFSLAPIVWLGEISYSLYMVHFPVLRALGIVLTPNRISPTAALPLAIIVCIACAAVVYYLIERPVRSRLRDTVGRHTKAALA